MGIGGIQKRVRDIVIDLATNHPEVKVHLLIKYKQPGYFSEEIEKYSNISIHYFSKTSYKPHHLPSIFWIFYWYIKLKPTIFLTFLDFLSMTMIIIKKITFWHSCKLVLNEGVLTSKYITLNRRLGWHILPKMLYRFADQIIVPTKIGKEDLHSHYSVPKKIISICHNWTLFPQTTNHHPKYDLLYVGRFEEEKNPWGFIKIVEEIKKSKENILAIMVGSGSQFLKIKKYVYQNQLHHNIYFTGIQKNDPKVFLLSKILLLPTKNEGMPNVVLEAGMCGVPTVSSDFAGAGEVILNTKTGYICSSLKEMSETCLKMLKDKALLKKIGMNAQRMILKKYHAKQQKEYIRLLLS